MADRDNAFLFGEIFKHFAEHPTDKNNEFAKKLIQETRLYDFDLAT